MKADPAQCSLPSNLGLASSKFNRMLSSPKSAVQDVSIQKLLSLGPADSPSALLGDAYCLGCTELTYFSSII